MSLAVSTFRPSRAIRSRDLEKETQWPGLASSSPTRSFSCSSSLGPLFLLLFAKDQTRLNFQGYSF